MHFGKIINSRIEEAFVEIKLVCLPFVSVWRTRKRGGKQNSSYIFCDLCLENGFTIHIQSEHFAAVVNISPTFSYDALNFR